MPGILVIFEGILVILEGFWAFSGNFGRFLGTCETLLAFSAFYLRVFGRLVGITGHNWA